MSTTKEITDRAVAALDVILPGPGPMTSDDMAEVMTVISMMAASIIATSLKPSGVDPALKQLDAAVRSLIAVENQMGDQA